MAGKAEITKVESNIAKELFLKNEIRRINY